MSETKALIIGAGPSLQKNLDDLERLGKFPGTIIVTDAAIKPVFERKNIEFEHCASLEDLSALTKYYTPQIVQENGYKISNGFISDRVAPTVRKEMTRCKIPVKVAAKVRETTTSNVGLYSWLISHVILGATDTYLIGMDHCYATDNPPPVDKESELFFWGFYTLYNPYDKIEIILNPAHELWQEEFHWNMTQYPDIKVHNCTGFGALYGKGIEWTPIKSMQSW